MFDRRMGRAPVASRCFAPRAGRYSYRFDARARIAATGNLDGVFVLASDTLGTEHLMSIRLQDESGDSDSDSEEEKGDDSVLWRVQLPPSIGRPASARSLVAFGPGVVMPTPIGLLALQSA
jgi:hypothetical protein